jgi:hypothetical protein
MDYVKSLTHINSLIVEYKKELAYEQTFKEKRVDLRGELVGPDLKRVKDAEERLLPILDALLAIKKDLDSRI